jgi:hypothetical protein
MRLRLDWLCSLLLTFCCLAQLASAQGLGRPGAEAGPTELYTRIVALGIDEIDSAKQTFTANLYLTVRWQDDRLAHEGSGVKVLDLDEAWSPQFQFTNQQRVVRTFPEQLLVSPSGEVTYRQRVWGTFSQGLDLMDFPLDTQTFTVQLVASIPFVFTDQLVMIQDEEWPSGLAPAFAIPDWDVVGWEASAGEYNPLNMPLGAPSFEFSFSAKRHVGYYLLKIMLPLLLIVMMSWIVFWIDPKEMGTQISVSVTSMLTLIAYRFMVGSAVPKISYLTKLDLFILSATLLVFTTLLEAVVTGTFARTERVELARKIDRVARVVYPSALICVLYFTFFS